MKTRPVSFEQAKREYPHRFTSEHVPAWAAKPCEGNGKFYAPQYASDREWYANTLFKGESELAGKRFCHSSGQTWPVGNWLDAPFKRAVSHA